MTRDAERTEDAQPRRVDAERYREAAEATLEQLDWCIGYLHGLRKVEISRALARNRGVIRTHLMDRPEEPLPAVKTSEQ
jgi:hypothetical protein